jgi:PAS domain S-box-containing protein
VVAANATAKALFGDCTGAPSPVPCPEPGETVDWRGAGGLWRLWAESGDDPAIVSLNGLGVTDLAEASRAAKARERQFAAVIDSAREGVVVAAAGRLVFVNPFMERLTGHDAATLRSRPFIDFLHPDDRDEVLGIHLRRLAGDAAPDSYVFRLETAWGEVRHVNVTSVRLDWEDSPATVSFLTDITALKAAEASLASLVHDQEAVIASRTASLRQANERLTAEIQGHKHTTETLKAARSRLARALRAKSVFLANVSHEIRTPLHVILGMAELALRPDSSQHTDMTRCLEMIREAGVSLRGILGDLLDLSRAESGRLELEAVPFSPRHVLEATLDAYRHVAERQGIALCGEAADEVPQQVVGDAGRLAQILGNLVGNALKFTPSGQVLVRLTPARPGRRAPDGRVALRFAVRDTGIGIAEDKQKSIFNSFSQADESIGRRYGGTGLGLAICRRLAGLMGGRMRLASAVGEGSEFSFTARFDPLDEKERTVVTAPRPSLPPLDILLAEDADLAAEMIEAFLVPKGHTVVRVVNGEEALTSLALRRFDVVLMDIQMPVMDGLAATRIIRSGTVPGVPADIPIIALTAYGAVRDRDRILASGVNGYVAKPVNFDQLLSALAESQGLTRPACPWPAPGPSPQDPPQAAQAPSPVPPQVAAPEPSPEWDAGRDEALDNLGGDQELYDRLVSVFLRDTPRDCERLKEALAALAPDGTGETARVALLAHSIKGNAGVVGASAASQRARDLEQAARNGRTDLFPGLFDSLSGAIEATLAAFAAKGYAPAAPS